MCHWLQPSSHSVINSCLAHCRQLNIVDWQCLILQCLQSHHAVYAYYIQHMYTIHILHIHCVLYNISNTVRFIYIYIYVCIYCFVYCMLHVMLYTHAAGLQALALKVIPAWLLCSLLVFLEPLWLSPTQRALHTHRHSWAPAEGDCCLGSMEQPCALGRAVQRSQRPIKLLT